MIAFSLIN